MVRRPADVYELMQYLSSSAAEAAFRGPADDDRLPTLKELSEVLGVGVSRLREQLEVARSLGLVEVRPRTGIRRLPFSFQPAVQPSLNYAIALDREYFDQFSDLRNHIEASYWLQAVEQLTDADKASLQGLMTDAWLKLRGTPIRIPHNEHRELHLLIFRRLENPFVIGILEAYWEAYEAVGLNLFAEYSYLEKVWNYHQLMVDSICTEEYESGYQALVEHKDLLFHRPLPSTVEEEIETPILTGK
jgi:DNA-binding FadR family transcriptional regulator